MALIMIGGLGFLVWEDISNCVGKAIRERTSFIRAIRKFTLHTKLVLIMQIGLFIFGTIGFLLCEGNNELTMANMDFSDKILVSSFHSASARTAGFFSIDMASMEESTKLLMIFLMFIGGASGSMAGGVKTVTFLVILAGFISMIKGKKNISIFKRTIPKETYEKACAVLIFMIVISYLSLFIVMCNLNEKTLVIDASFDIISSIESTFDCAVSTFD
jgi:trk system potassium uptake protein TrkH